MKKILLRNEIEMMQLLLEEKVFPTKEYRLKLRNKLEDLKKLLYKVKEKKREILYAISEEGEEFLDKNLPKKKKPTPKTRKVNK